ncbi:MAG TPA: DNA topoisomerase III, partial [Lachnospiraceae bacterium]|nr:DNA topoisomerase III [Lachnospiraceae bacterium]
AKIISVKKEKKFTAPPKLYDLTTLQRESNKHFGFTAQQTLDVVQKLYEAKLVTYPRTDSRYLTEDMEGTALDVILNIKDTFDFETVERPDIKPVMNNKYVTDHHAIIPTENLNKTALLGLKENDKKVLTLISLRLLTATAPKEEYELTKIVAECENNKFTATNKKIINHGFKAVEKQYLSSEEKDNAEFGNISENSDYEVTSKVTEHETQPPKAYTEDTLLSAMEKAGKKDFSEDAERVGLGTPATRAGIIETLIKRGYIERKSKNLIPTTLGKEVVSSVPDKLKSSEMTVEWENELSHIAKGGSDSSGFMKQVEEFVRDIVKE